MRKRRLRVFFARGLAALLPTLLTLFILITGFQFLDGYLGEPITNGAIRRLAPLIGHKPESLTEALGPLRPFVTVFISVAIVFFVGFFLATFVGNRLYYAFERFVFQFPVVKAIYPYAKQFTDFFFREKPVEWQAVVAVEYPRREMWSIGFITAQAFEELSRGTGRDLVSVYLPSSPLPFTGYVIAVPREDLVALKMSVEEAIRWIVSGGVLIPGPGGAPQPGPPPRART